MSILTRSKFKGIRLDKINHYIRLINENLNIKLDETIYWQAFVSNLMNFLNENSFIQYEGPKINDKSISNFITRLNKKKKLNSIDKNNFLPSKNIMTRTRTVIPSLIDNIEGLNQLREQTLTNLVQKEIKKKDLSKAINDMDQYKERMTSIRPKKTKKQKYGAIGMGDLVKIVATLKQDVKQIKDAQSVESANEWIHYYKSDDLYEATGQDLNGDEILEVVVRTRNSKKPVIVNGYTTVPSLFPYRNAYYTSFPTVKQRKEARNQGINLKWWINNIYDPNYDETGRKVAEYKGGSYEDFETKLKKAGIKP